ncbi:single-stranded DNA-binding protein [Herbiconiux moechotypicola]|uniref:Single-stranded DNA-binding protein n=1 Tax=Herbiconiux moechotypicola TaxID=637393 RepID=A0ABP5QH16_9MICO|nr:single-stranded DNA-binding protein [Herbiconiux moechotypicola]MCS5729802.1 single-stranded DNA-binding protein [Herbiconiux moechotypicola]
MPDLITITGTVATPPRHIVTSGGLDIASFRLASSQRRYDKTLGKWVDADTNWYSVSAFRHLAVNILSSLSLGQRVVVSGRLRVRHWESGEKTGIAVELEADAVGHDLSWGTSSFTKVIPSTPNPGGGAEGESVSGSFPERLDDAAIGGGSADAGDEPSELPGSGDREPAEELLPF